MTTAIVRRIAVLTLTLVSSATLSSVAPAVADPVGTGYSLVFSDEFNGTALDTSVWYYRTDVKANSAQRPENVSVSGGNLNIALKQENYAGKAFTGGGVISKRALRYGYYETRAKVNDGGGWHTAFWLQAGDGTTTYPAEQRTEVDVFEIDSLDPSVIRQNVITWHGSGVAADPFYSTDEYDIGMDLRQWHTYGADWSESGVKFYVDGVLKYTAAYTPDVWMHDYTNLWLTSIAAIDDTDASKLPSSVQFDYVRYWQKDSYIDNDGPAAYGYSENGTWNTSSLGGWTKDSTTRYAACGVAGQTATWQPNLRASGTYEVFFFNVVQSSSDPSTRLDVVRNGTTSTVTINGTAGTSSWVSLGRYELSDGTGSYARLTSSGAGCARADAVKFVRL